MSESAVKNSIPGVKWLTKEQFEEMLEERCWRILGITLSEFRKRREAGKYRNRHTGAIA